MAKKTRGWKGKIPFSAPRPPTQWNLENGLTDGYRGGQLSYGQEWRYDDDERDVSKPDRFGTYWLDNFVFEDTLEFESCSRGRSAATFTFKRQNGETVEFFMSEVTRLFHYFKDGKVTGRFTFVKRGANYSCSILDPSESE